MHDILQILPVFRGGSRAQIVSSAVFNSSIWKHFITLKLTRNMRVERLIQQDTISARIQRLKDYSKWLLSIGNGTAPSSVKNIDGIIKITSQM